MSNFDDALLHIDFGSRVVTVDGKVLTLNPDEYCLLAALVRHQGQILTMDQLMDLVSADPKERDLISEKLSESPGYVNYCIMRIRRKIGWDDDEYSPVASIRGFGYCYRSPNR